MKTLRTCLVVTAFLLVTCCLLYPALVTAAGGALFPGQAKGSLIEKNGKVVGSELIGQTLDRPMEHLEYFWGRPSAASADPKVGEGVVQSGGSNYGPLNPSLKDEVSQHIAALRATGVTGPIPGDLVTKSASGLDPHISPAAADIQVPRVAKARGLSEAVVRVMVAAHTEPSTMGLFGESRVNVLALNLELDARQPVPAVVSPDAPKFAPPPASAAPSADPSAAPSAAPAP